jgi:hypothetical protein
VGTILSNTDAEALILDVRAGRWADAAVVDGGSGAFIVFPTVVIVERPGRGQLVFPIHVSVEPGSLCRGDGEASVEATVDGIDVRGAFTWTFSEHPGAAMGRPAGYRFRSNGGPVRRPPWAHQLPGSMVLPRRAPAQLLHDQTRIVRQGRWAEHWLLVLSQRVMEACCRGPLGRALAAHPLVQDADVVQRGLQAAHRLLAVYASPDRPPRSWVGMIRLDARRDMFRGVSQLDWLPREMSEAVDRARWAGISLHADAAVTLAALIDASIDAGLPLPRLSPRQVRSALSAPELVSFEAPLGAWRGWQPQEGGICGPDPALDAVDDQPGRAAAAVAALVASDRETVARAFLGDPTALKTVADRVLLTLRRPGEGVTATRRRCRDRFLATGELLATTGRRDGFPGQAAGDLSALDAALWSALGRDGSDPAPRRVTDVGPVNRAPHGSAPDPAGRAPRADHTSA